MSPRAPLEWEERYGDRRTLFTGSALTFARNLWGDAMTVPGHQAVHDACQALGAVGTTFEQKAGDDCGEDYQRAEDGCNHRAG